MLEPYVLLPCALCVAVRPWTAVESTTRLVERSSPIGRISPSSHDQTRHRTDDCSLRDRFDNKGLASA